MWFNGVKNSSTFIIITQATSLKQKGFYAAAKHLVKPYLAAHPNNQTLRALYQRIEMLQLVKINRRH